MSLRDKKEGRSLGEGCGLLKKNKPRKVPTVRTKRDLELEGGNRVIVLTSSTDSLAESSEFSFSLSSVKVLNSPFKDESFCL